MASYQQSQQDEGYSEDPLSGSTILSTSSPPWFSNMAVTERTEFVMSLIAQLPTSEVAEIVQRLRPRLFINFFNYLPPEVCLKILGFLDPESLMATAQASREWMSLAMDRRLWEQLYIRDGFRVFRSEVDRFERLLSPEQPHSSLQSDEHSSKRRVTPNRVLAAGSGDSDLMDVDTPMHKQPSIFGSAARFTSEPQQDDDIVMETPRSPVATSSKFTPRRSIQAVPGKRISTQPPSVGKALPLEASSLVVLDRSSNKKMLNWQYLYSQRRRLEANWETERYTNFQLPHPNYPEEAHEECIYTIQHSGRYLVSGSRDKTLRVWDLDTQRLIRPPLRAHSGSVLCLQFDADPEEDLIVSGSSDATVVLWKFSTGQIIQRLRKAHRESVLNVRFDKRVLVTCSKDKMIKIFNRRPLNPGELGYPLLVNPVPIQLNNYGFNPDPTAGLPVKPPYSLIGVLEGHGAAVNAVQILGNEVVSASGDRTVKVWNWVDKTCTRTLVGHTKGIACVQYDGRRIVSGSSDNEVKVFDKESGLEVASLHGHTNLVRTVQAGFGDLPYSEEEDREVARMTDQEYFKAVDAGTVSQDVAIRGRHRNAGSRNPKDITAYGAKIPPGGGGGRFGRIVSGSYDETIIIWRRDKEGVWRAQHILRQEIAAQAASRNIDSQPPVSTAPTDQEPSGSSLLSEGELSTLIDTAISQGPANFRLLLRTHPQLVGTDLLNDRIAGLPDTHRQLFQSVILSTVGQNGQILGFIPSAPTSSAGPSSHQTHATTTIIASSNNGNPIVTSSTSTTSNLPPNNNPANSSQAAAVHAPPPVSTNHAPGGANMARVFKLQFDARRIICCSQTSVIVGWDFANGDQKLIEASRFFAPVE